MKLKLVAFVAFILLPLVGLSIVVEDYSIATAAPTGDWDLNWDFVYEHPDGSAVAVDPYWVLTAAHVADYGGSGTLTIGTTDYFQQEIIYNNTADLALIRYDKALPGYYSLYTGTFPTGTSHGSDNRLDAILVGYGTTGTVSSASYSASAWNDDPNGSGMKRWGTQKIDGTTSADYDVGGITGMTYNDGFGMLFNSADSDYEAGVGTYDSGGGTFVEEGGVWKLAGINTVRYGGPTDFAGTFSVSTSAYEPWIAQTIPEPSTAIMLIGIAALFGVAHRIRCMFE